MEPAAPSHPLVVIGASFGGVEALITLVTGLPRDFLAYVAVVQHIGFQPSVLPELLSRAGSLKAVLPRSGERLRLGQICVAPPDQHLLVTPGSVRLSRGTRENPTRPATDPLFRTAALHWGRKAIGVVLAGELDDGTAGLAAIKLCGGCTVVQRAPGREAPARPGATAAARWPAAARNGRPPREAPPEALLREQSVFEGVEPMDNLGGRCATAATPATPTRSRAWSAQAEGTGPALQASFRALKEREQLLRRMAGVSRSLGDDAQAEVGMFQAARVQEQAARLAELIAEGSGGA